MSEIYDHTHELLIKIQAEQGAIKSSIRALNSSAHQAERQMVELTYSVAELAHGINLFKLDTNQKLDGLAETLARVESVL